MRILVIDNYDSFTWNLVQLVGSLGAKVEVVKNDSASAGVFIEQYKPERIIISPGPGTPAESGASLDVIALAAAKKIPLLGVCLGHQCLAVQFAAKKEKKSIVRCAPELLHGKVSKIYHKKTNIFAGISSPFIAARYHSLIVDHIHQDFSLTAWTGSQKKPELIMAMQHNSLPLIGVQFHPESFMTEHGKQLMENFLSSKWYA